MSRQVLSAKLKHSHIFNYLIETVTYSSSKREKNNPMIWLKLVVGRVRSSPRRLHQQPLASPLPRPGMPQDGEHQWGLWGRSPSPGALWQAWQHQRGAPAPLVCCLGGHGGCRYSMATAWASPAGACWVTRAQPSTWVGVGPPLAAQSWATWGTSHRAHAAIDPGYCGLKTAWL